MKTLVRQIAETLEAAYDADPKTAYKFNELIVSSREAKIIFRPSGNSLSIDPNAQSRTLYKNFEVSFDATYPIQDVQEALERIFKNAPKGEFDSEIEGYAVALHREEFETGIVKTLNSDW